MGHGRIRIKGDIILEHGPGRVSDSFFDTATHSGDDDTYHGVAEREAAMLDA